MIGITMRMERVPVSEGKEEIRDCLAADWHFWRKEAFPDAIMAPVPNLAEDVMNFLETLPFKGFIFSGGDDWGLFPARDLTETLIYEYAKERDLPVIGVCRGAQVLNLLAGGKVRAGYGKHHAATRHNIQVSPVMAQKLNLPLEYEVNSYHNLGITEADLAECFHPWAKEGDGSVEAFECASGKNCGILWHPERERPFGETDMNIFKHYLGSAL